MDVLADSTFDAAHLFVVEAKKERSVGLPKPTLATMFEVVTAGKLNRARGAASDSPGATLLARDPDALGSRAALMRARGTGWRVSHSAIRSAVFLGAHPTARTRFPAEW
jgi:hypothetical protein